MRRNTAIVHPVAEALFDGPAADTRLDNLTSLEQCVTDPQACSLCQHEISEGVRNASVFKSRQEHPLAGG